MKVVSVLLGAVAAAGVGSKPTFAKLVHLYFSNIYIYIYIYIGYQHGQAIQLSSMIMLHDLCVTVCVCSEGNALFHIRDTFKKDILFWILVKIKYENIHCSVIVDNMKEDCALLEKLRKLQRVVHVLGVLCALGFKVLSSFTLVGGDGK